MTGINGRTAEKMWSIPDPVERPAGRASEHGLRLAIIMSEKRGAAPRLRVTLSDEEYKYLAAGLDEPRIRVDGTVGKGLRIDAVERGRNPMKRQTRVYNPTHTGRRWTLTMPLSLVEGRMAGTDSQPVAFTRERDDRRAYLDVPRLPDAFLPVSLLSRLPRSQIEPETAKANAFKAAEARLSHELGMLPGEPAPVAAGVPVPALPLSRAVLPEAATEVPAGRSVVAVADSDLRAVPALPDNDGRICELKLAIGMVNDLAGQLGEDIMLAFQDGRLVAKRRVITFEDI